MSFVSKCHHNGLFSTAVESGRRVMRSSVPKRGRDCVKTRLMFWGFELRIWTIQAA